MEEIKICTKCKEEKDFNVFYKNKSTKDGLGSHCKSCRKEYDIINKDKIADYQKQWNKTNDDYKKQWYEDNKEVLKTRPTVQQNEAQKEHKSEYMKIYYLNNKDNINKLAVEYQRQRLKSDLLYRLSHNIRGNIGSSFKRGKRRYRKSKKTEDILGCSIEWFKEYIESLFTEGMNWELMGKEIHLDHIIPVSIARSEKEIIMFNHWTNFQPLWAEENRKKSDKIDFIYNENKLPQ